jgi:flagellar hook protein FlgE
MGNEQQTIQSLKAVDSWIDVINANINGGVRTGFKSSRLKFGGSNVDIRRAGTATNLPLQLPEAGLMTANTIIDFSQGAVTASTENTHLAIQGEGFFALTHASMWDFNNTAGNTQFGATLDPDTAGVSPSVLLTRDGEFRTDKWGFLVHSSGYYLSAVDVYPAGNFEYSGAAGGFGQPATAWRLIYNDIDNPNGPLDTASAQITTVMKLSDFIAQNIAAFGGEPGASFLIKVASGKQSLQFSKFGSTVFDFGFKMLPGNTGVTSNPNILVNPVTTADCTVLSKSLEASNASMTQSVPELSLAQKLFSALTKVLQVTQTNTDAILNLVR